MRKLLDVCPNKDITLYTHHSIPLQIPIVKDNVKGWFMSCFINIMYRYEYPQYFDYTDYKIFYDYIFDKDVMTASFIPSINTKEHFSSFIEQDKYIYAWIDQFYISSTQYFDNEHNIHPVMIYGYDDEKDIYYCVGFSIRKSVYYLEVKRDEYHEALDKVLNVKKYINDDDYFCLFKIRSNTRSTFVLERFINELKNYIGGKGSSSTAYLARHEVLKTPEYYNRSVFGIEVTRSFCDILKNGMNDRRVFDYRVMHMICENKKLIFLRLQYLEEMFALPDEAKQKISEYGKISNDYDAIRMLSYKYALSENGGKRALDMIKEKDHIESIYQKMMYLYKMEKEILRSLIPMLLKLEIKFRFPNFILHKIDSHNGELTATFEGEKQIIAMVICNDNGIYRGVIKAHGQEDFEYSLDASSAHLFYVVPIDNRVDICSYVSDEMSDTSAWLLEVPE